MFATLLGALPSPPSADSPGAAIETVVRAQEAAGLEPITDGRLPAAREGATAVERWTFAQGLTDRAVKQALSGPAATAATAITGLATAIRDLADAGCLLIELEETGLARLADPDVRTHFAAAHGGLFAELERLGIQPDRGDVHLSLSLTGSAPPMEALAMILDLPYASLAVDLIHGPDSWNLVTRLPGDRGVIAGALSADGPAMADGAGEPKEVLLWAANYAASTRGRGLARVGIGSAGSWSTLTWEAAVARLHRLGEAASLASKPLDDETVRNLDPRAVSIRRAALGHDG
jgi:methionine synthase II (cobalamin-independent)